jgi:hypothetical protein
MSSRTSRIIALAGMALLAACGQGASDEATSRSPVSAMRDWVEGVTDERPRILCAIGAGVALAPDCRLEAQADGEGRFWLLSRPDGGFRRLRQGKDGRLSVADGAIEARIARSGEMLGVIVGEERYAVPLNALNESGKR